MAETLPFDVFLSHSTKDKDTVRPLAERLHNEGLRVWFDEWEIKPGDNIPYKVDQGLENSRVLVLCMSANAFGSDWSTLECNTYRFRDPLNKERRFIPLQLDDAPIKGTLAQFLAINWSPAKGEQEFAKLVEACRPPVAAPTGESQAIRVQFEKRVLSLGHTERIRSVAFSPDGHQALSGSSDKTVRLWEVATGKCVRVLEGHTDEVNSVTWSPKGVQALSGSDDSTVRLWEVATGKCVRVLEGHTNGVWSVTWSPDGRHALSGSMDKTVRVWEVGTGECVRVLEGHTDEVNSVTWSPDGVQALSGSDDSTVRLWEVATGKCVHVLDGHTDYVRSVTWSPDGRQALSGADDRTVRLWELSTGKCVRVLAGHTASVLSVTWSPDGVQALSGSDDSTVRLWEVSTWKCVHVLEGHTNGVWSVTWSPDGRRALSGSVDNTVRLWEVATGECVRVMEGHTADVLSVTWSPDGRRALSGSEDNTVRLWEVSTWKCVHVLEGHTNGVWSVTWSPDGRRALSGSTDKTVRLWEIATGKCVRVLEGHTEDVLSVTWSPDGRRALSGSTDKTMRLWEMLTGKCVRVLAGHTASLLSVTWSPDGRQALSGSDDRTVRLWELSTGKCVRVLAGHTASVLSVTWSPDGRHALSGSMDKTVRLWEIATRKCVRVLEGHTASVLSVTWSPDGRQALSGSDDKTVRLWDVATGKCLGVIDGHSDGIRTVALFAHGRGFSSARNGVWREWDLSGLIAAAPAARVIANDVQYTNAKVLLVGDTNAGKTGLTHRLAAGKWKPSDGSTVGAWTTQWSIPDPTAKAGIDREIWLWDFGGQADQRLIHQLYMDRTALILLLFNADQEEVLPGLRDWQTALRRCVKGTIPQFLVAGRIDAGFKASRQKLRAFAEEHGLPYHETSAQTGEGCAQLHADLLAAIQWGPAHTSPRIFKLIKDEILKLRDAGEVLHTFKELRDLLWRRLPNEPRFSDETLKTVIGLLDGPGAVKELAFGTYVLLAPEWVSAYAQAVVRTLRSPENDLGALPLRSIAEGKLIYQSVGRDGIQVDMKRLPPAAEAIVLGEMERQLEERGLCLRQGDRLVFPSHCGRDRPEIVEHPAVFVSYAVNGYLDDIYATLVVKLAYSESFDLADLWRDAADFVTLVDDHHLGIKLTRASASAGEISVFFGKGVTPEEQVIFAKYIHAHLDSTSDRTTRLRHYVCPICHTPKGNPKVLMEKLLEHKKRATTECDKCEKRFSLWDLLEQKFASPEVRAKVEELQADDLRRLDSRRKGKLLVLDVGARITSANQKWHEIPQEEDEGIDIELEFTNDDGEGTGRRLYLQLKSGNSFLTKRKDGVEIFKIKKQRWVQYWLQQPHPVMLVVGTFAEDHERRGDKDRFEFADVRWMEITSELKRLSANGTKQVKQIEFRGERLDMSSVHHWRQRMLANE